MAVMSLNFVVGSLLFGVVTYVFFQIVSWTVQYWRWRSFFNSCQGEPDFHWLYGNLHKLPLDSEGRLKYWMTQARKYPKWFRFWYGAFTPFIMVAHPETVQKILKTSEGKPVGFGGMYRPAIPWLGEGLLISSGKKWARSRRLLTPAFHFDILKPYVRVYNEAAAIALNKVESGKLFEVFGMVSLATLDVILRCAFSYENDVQIKSETHPYVCAVTELMEILVSRARSPLLAFDFLFYRTTMGKRFQTLCDYVHDFADRIIERRQKELVNLDLTERKYLDFLDILLTAKDENGKGLLPSEIREEVDTFLFEGHDTTASSIAWTLYSLAMYPEYQAKVKAEVDSVLTGRPSDDIEWNDLSKLEFLTMCIKESMRHHCPVPFVQRQISKELTLDGKTFPAGTTFSLSMYVLHHNPEVWKDPDTYNPYRFSKENIDDIDSFAFTPFSAGPRNCIGQHFAMNEQKVFLARMLHRYTLELDPNHKVEKKIAAVMRTEKGMMMYARRRN